MNKTLKEAVESATTVADILTIMDGVTSDEVTIGPIVYNNGVPRWDAEYSANGAALAIEWINVEPDGPELAGLVHVRNPLYNQGVTAETAAYMITMAYKTKKQKQEQAALPPKPEPDDEDIPFPF